MRIVKICEILRDFKILLPQVYLALNCGLLSLNMVHDPQWRIEEGSTPPPEIPKALQNRAKLNPIVKTVKNC